jgi:hypothetical protein
MPFRRGFRIGRWLLIYAIAALAFIRATALGDALDDLKKGTNGNNTTGKLFDGSSNDRPGSGMDIKVKASPVSVPTPTAPSGSSSSSTSSSSGNSSSSTGSSSVRPRVYWAPSGPSAAELARQAEEARANADHHALLQGMKYPPGYSFGVADIRGSVAAMPRSRGNSAYVPGQPVAGDITYDQLRAISGKIRQIHVPVPEITYDIQPLDKKSEDMLRGVGYGVAFFKGAIPAAARLFGKYAEDVAVGAKKADPWISVVLITGKTIIAAEDAADVYITRENDALDKALQFLKNNRRPEPEIRTEFAYLMGELRKNPHLVDRGQYPDGMFEAAKAIVDSSRKSTTRILWMDEHLPPAVSNFLQSKMDKYNPIPPDVRDDLKRALMSPEVRLAAIDTLVKETSAELIGRGIDSGIQHFADPLPTSIIHVNQEALREGNLYNCYSALAVGKRILKDPNQSARSIALARSIMSDASKDLTYMAAVGIPKELAFELGNDKLISPVVNQAEDHENAFVREKLGGKPKSE